MKYIRTYEGFFSKIGKKISDYLNKDDRNLIPADFYSNEEEYLIKLGFRKNIGSKNQFIYVSETSNIEITIAKYWDELVPGAADKLFNITINTDGINKTESTNNFEKVESIIMNYIPKVEQDIRKYNL